MNAPSSRPVEILYFAWIRERTGRARESLELPPEITTVAGLVAWLRTRGPHYAHAFERPEVVRAAVDKVHVKPDASIATAREIAFFPPVTGG